MSLRFLIGPITGLCIWLGYVLLRKLFPAVYDAKDEAYSWDELRRKYAKWEVFGLLAMVVLTPPFAYSWYRLFASLRQLQGEDFAGDAYVFQCELFVFAFLSVFMGAATAIPAIECFCRIVFQKHMRGFMVFQKLKYRIDPYKVSTPLMGLLVGGVLLVFMAVLDNYAAFTETEIVIDRLWSVSEERYSYEDVQRILVSERAVAPAGNTAEGWRFVIHFDDGHTWNSHNAPSRRGIKEVLSFVAEKSGVTPEKVPILTREMH